MVTQQAIEFSARDYRTGLAIRVAISGRRIERIGPDSSRTQWALPWVAPALVDLQLNGHGGQEFSSPQLTPERLATIAQAVDGFGLAWFLPALTTQSPEILLHAARVIAWGCGEGRELGGRVRGIHLEGPWISPDEGVRGAHPIAHVRTPDWDEFRRLQDAAEGRIRLVTLAPELPGALRFIERLRDAGVVVALGHTAATDEQIRAAAEAGARLSTHLGNGCHRLLPRHRNYVWAQLAEDRLAASLIADGHHLPPAVVKCFVRAKTPGRCILVSDLAAQAGLPPGRYQGGLCDVELLPDGRLVVAGQSEYLAGATSPLGVGVANVMAFAGLSLPEALSMASSHPAELLGIEPGRLEPGGLADLILFDLETPPSENQGTPSSPSAPRAPENQRPAEFRLRATIRRGAVVHGQLPAG